MQRAIEVVRDDMQDVVFRRSDYKIGGGNEDDEQCPEEKSCAHSGGEDGERWKEWNRYLCAFSDKQRNCRDGDTLTANQPMSNHRRGSTILR